MPFFYTVHSNLIDKPFIRQMAEALACKGRVLNISYPCTGNKK